jgi:hypothetical protein
LVLNLKEGNPAHNDPQDQHLATNLSKGEGVDNRLRLARSWYRLLKALLVTDLVAFEDYSMACSKMLADSVSTGRCFVKTIFAILRTAMATELLTLTALVNNR